MKIEDGTGTGLLASVDSLNRLETASVSTLKMADSSEIGQAFIGGSSLLPVTTTKGTMFYLKNTDIDKNFRVNRLLVSSNGGNTNFNRPIEVQLFVGTTAPTANTTQTALGNLNFTSPNIASADVIYWDGVGTGMTVASGGLPGTVVNIAQGTSEILLQGSMIIGPGQSISIQAKGVEVSQLTVSYSGFYE